MSKIETVSCQRLSVPLHTPFVTALRRTTTTDTVVVRITDTDGVTGWGEAPQVWQVTGESLAGSEACVMGPFHPLLIGADADDITALSRSVSRAVARNFGAKSAVDVALHDLTARRRGVSLPALLGTTAHRVGTDVTLAAGDASDLAQAAADRVADGFSVLKVKVGTDATSDVARVRAARNAVGADVKIRLDANQGWIPRDAVRVIRVLEDAGADVE